ILGAAAVWVGMDVFHVGYRELYRGAALLTLAAAAAAWYVGDPGHTGVKRKAFVFRREYGLFYLLAVLFGVRKQIFLVFGPWVLIRVFGQDAAAMARLFIVSSVAGIFLKPWLCGLIDRFGERRVLTGDAVVLFLVCLTYAGAERLLPPAAALAAVFACYVLDDALFALRAAHVTYLARIVASADELTASISTSYSLEHVVSLVAPVLAGMIWTWAGYPWVFGAAAGTAVLMGLAARRIPEAGPVDSRPRG
ncbi:MFS transporter, partial [Dissulfurirhabdus thermomarina]|nr:MFS transporter [Dissulfurirhabdus thermomarina]